MNPARKFLLQSHGDPSVGINGDEMTVTKPGFDDMDRETQALFLDSIRQFAVDFFDDARVTIFDVTDEKSDPKLVSLDGIKRGLQHP